MRLMTIAMAGLLTIGLTSCNDFSGQFKSTQKLKIVHTSIFGKKKTKSVPAGQYEATLGFSSKRKIKLTLKRSGKKDIKVKIKLPKYAQFPSFQGAIVIPAAQTGQKYDIKGRIASQVTRSSSTDTYESCTYTDQVRKCEKVCREVTTPSGRVITKCKKVCKRVTLQIRGSRDVTYHYKNTHKKIKLGIFNPSSTSHLAEFKGTLNNSQKVYDYSGICR